MTSRGARRWWALAAITLGVLAVGLDVTVLSVALPTLAVALKASESDLQWFSSGYALTLAAGMLPAGVLGDRFGRKRILLGSLVLFGAGSAACAFAVNSAQFIAGRLILGVAGAAIVVMALSVMTVIFTEEERPRAVGIWAAANFLALPIGPIFGGWLLTNFWWGWIFLMNVPVAAIGLLAVLTLVPESRASQRPAIDPAGMVLASGGLAGVTYGLIELGRNGWTDPALLAILLFGVLVVVGFFRWERHLTLRPGGRPLIDLTLFRSRGFTWGVILAALGGLALIGLIFTIPQYMQGVAGLDPQGSGVRLLPIIVGLIFGAVPADRVADRVGPKVTVATGFAITTAGLLLGSTTAVDPSPWFIVAWMLRWSFPRSWRRSPRSWRWSSCPGAPRMRRTWTAHPSRMWPEVAIGLRERKKLRTRALIQKEAIRLFLERGFEATTIEEIAEAAEISPSTFFNYFPTKEEVVFQDELDPLILAAFNAPPEGTHPIRALRDSMKTVFGQLTAEQDNVMRQRISLMSSTPALRSAMLTQFADLVDQIAELIAGRVGREPTDFAIRNLAGALLGVMMSALLIAASDPKADMIDVADRAMAHLEAGLPL